MFIRREEAFVGIGDERVEEFIAQIATAFERVDDGLVREYIEEENAPMELLELGLIREEGLTASS